MLAQLPARSATRTRAVPARLKRVSARFSACYALDGTTLEALFRKLKALQEVAEAPLAGHLAVVVDLVTHIPAKIWFAENPSTNDKALLPQVLAWLPTHSLLVFDLGYFAFTLFDALSEAGSWFVTRLRRKRTSFTVQQVLWERPLARDRIVKLGKYRSNPSTHHVRLIEVCIDGVWRQYVTNVLDPQQLSVLEAVALYETALAHRDRFRPGQTPARPVVPVGRQPEWCAVTGLGHLALLRHPDRPLRRCGRGPATAPGAHLRRDGLAYPILLRLQHHRW